MYTDAKEDVWNDPKRTNDMKLAEDIWLGSVAARNNLMAAANFSAAFYGNAAVQGVSLGLTAPQRFWSAMARAAEAGPLAPGPDAARCAPDPASAPSARDERAAGAVVAARPAEEVATDEAPVDAPPIASPLLLDAPRGGVADDLTAIRGIGAKMAASLNEFGIYHYDQIAGLDGAGIDWLDQHLPGFKRNCARFDLVSGAGQLV